MKDRLGATWFGPVRVVLLVVVALAALTDLTTWSALVGSDDSSAAPGAPPTDPASTDTPPSATPTAPPGPDVVALDIVAAVAADDCASIVGLLDEGFVSPTIAACLDGTAPTVELSDLSLADMVTDGDTSAVTIALLADGAPVSVVVELRLDGDRWLMTELRPADS